MSYRPLHLLLGGLLVLSSAAADAKWHRASSAHFVIYADERPDKLRDLAVRLERFDKAVHMVRNVKDFPPGEGNKVTVFRVESMNELGGLLGYRNSGIAGVYRGRATGPIALVPRTIGRGERGEVRPESVFFHEYAHHLMLQDVNYPMPQWLSEGFAEFMGAARFTDNGAIGLGLVPRHREYGLQHAVEIPLEQLLTGNYTRLHHDQFENLYARGWLLYHFLNFEPSRRGQIDRYLKALAAGQAPLLAAQGAFGDLRRLEKELSSYQGRLKLQYIQIPASQLQIGPITVEPVSPGADAIMPIHIRSRVGVTEKQAVQVAADARRIAAHYPTDPFVQVALSEAELDAKNYDAAEAAASRALQANPRSIEAMIFKGRAIMERTAAKKLPAASWEDARRWFLAANKIDSEDPEPLMLFHETYVKQGIAPTANAAAALHYASVLAPQDEDLRLTSALQYLYQRKIAEAKRKLMPIAWHPHRKGVAAKAREMIALLNTGKVQEAIAVANRPPDEKEKDED